MTVEQFNIHSAAPSILYIITVALIAFGVISLVFYVLRRDRFEKLPTFGGGKIIGIGIATKYGVVILGIALIALGGFMYAVTYATDTSTSVVTIDSGYLNVEADFFGSNSTFSNRGSITVTSQEIVSAFVGEIGSDDFGLRKDYGINYGETNVGRYTLGNGAKAYIASTNSTCLIMELINGEYLILVHKTHRP